MCMEIGLIKKGKDHVAKFETMHDGVSITFVLAISENIEKMSKKEREEFLKKAAFNIRTLIGTFFDELSKKCKELQCK